ncbi:hypothetical protein NPIL_239581 [Nephila pilipes]|uniref:Uncharacterized protein n=1 Tax=Nephila pilipes TaxID=299642 RepID=A0A8X6MM65_NEPPI|nr:hypothetical protein NPIL_239581 [Nephila pilipes]
MTGSTSHSISLCVQPLCCWSIALGQYRMLDAYPLIPPSHDQPFYHNCVRMWKEESLQEKAQEPRPTPSIASGKHFLSLIVIGFRVV